MDPTDAACELMIELDVLLHQADHAASSDVREPLLARLEICAAELERLLDHLDGQARTDALDACDGAREVCGTATASAHGRRAMARAA